VAAWAISALRNLSITSVANPAFNSFGIDPEPAQTGKVTITVGNTDGFNWPKALTDCARQLNIGLPTLNSVVGRTITWNLEQANAVPVTTWCITGQTCALGSENAAGTSPALLPDHTATFAYSTNTELADQAARGDPITTDAVLVEATVSLNIASLQTLIKGLVLGAVPGGVRIVVGHHQPGPSSRGR
jgi:hypothetical protein